MTEYQLDKQYEKSEDLRVWLFHASWIITLIVFIINGESP